MEFVFSSNFYKLRIGATLKEKGIYLREFSEDTNETLNSTTVPLSFDFSKHLRKNWFSYNGVAGFMEEEELEQFKELVAVNLRDIFNHKMNSVGIIDTVLENFIMDIDDYDNSNYNDFKSFCMQELDFEKIEADLRRIKVNYKK